MFFDASGLPEGEKAPLRKRPMSTRHDLWQLLREFLGLHDQKMSDYR